MGCGRVGDIEASIFSDEDDVDDAGGDDGPNESNDDISLREVAHSHQEHHQTLLAENLNPRQLISMDHENELCSFS